MTSPTLPLAPDAPWLAPLAGFSDLPFRLLCREHGCKAAVTEMVSARGLHFESPGTSDLLATLPEDSPLVVQLFGNEVEYIKRAMDILLEQGMQWFDLNSGCPVRKVVKTGAGAALHRDVDRLIEVAACMARMAPGRCGVKFRRGWADGEDNYLDIANRLQDVGTSWLTLHPRTARQGYSGQADWSCLERLVQSVDLPVIASGDLFTAEDGVRCVEQTGVSTVMFARGALYGPHIFSRYLALTRGESAPETTPAELAGVIMRHATLAREHLRDRHALLKMRTIVPRYVRHLPGARALRAKIVTCRSWESLEQSISEFLL